MLAVALMCIEYLHVLFDDNIRSQIATVEPSVSCTFLHAS